LTDRGQVLTIDCVTRAITGTASLGTSLPSTASLSPDGGLLLIAGTSLNDLNTAENSVLAFDTATGTLTLLTLGVANLTPAFPRELHWHPDGARIVYLHPPTATLEIYEPAARRVTRRILLPRDAGILDAMDLSPNGGFALVRDTSGLKSYIVDLESGETLDTTALPAGPGFLLPRF
jgi:DNA-binding beta-propeller fold protein YncE